MQTTYFAKKPQDVYRRQAILTASPAELIIMLFDGCHKSMALAARAIDRSDPAEAHKQLMKAQNIVTELINSLDMRYEMSQGLQDIYEFMLRELESANLRKDAAALPGLMDIAASMRDTWRQVFESQRKGALSLAED
jgi:flagellar protein FliS